MLRYVVGGIVTVVVIILWWRLTSVTRGARQRDARLLPIVEPVVQALAQGQEPDLQLVHQVASNSCARYYLYEALKFYERLDLFPEEYRSEEAQAAAKLAYWMMHPNELQDPPDEMELVEVVTREIDAQSCRFYVFKYRMPPGHWAGEDWLLGYAGPFVANEPPYSDLPGAFSNSWEKYGEAKPEELVDWYIGLVRGKKGA